MVRRLTPRNAIVGASEAMGPPIGAGTIAATVAGLFVSDTAPHGAAIMACSAVAGIFLYFFIQWVRDRRST